MALFHIANAIQAMADSDFVELAYQLHWAAWNTKLATVGLALDETQNMIRLSLSDGETKGVLE